MLCSTQPIRNLSTKILMEMRYYNLKRKERGYSIIVYTVLSTNKKGRQDPINEKIS